MAEKKFKKKFMHPTRRKLVNMIETGEYQKDTQVSLSGIKQTTKRNIGDIWEESGTVYEQKSYGKVKQSKLSNEILVIFGKRMVVFTSKNHMAK